MQQNKTLPVCIVCIGVVLLILTLWLPFASATSNYTQHLQAYPQRMFIEEIDMRNQEAMHLSLVEYAKIFYAATTYEQGRATNIATLVVIAVCMVCILLTVLFTLLKKPITMLVFDCMSCLVFCVVRWEFSERGIIPTSKYDWGVASYSCYLGMLCIGIGAIWMIIRKKKDVCMKTCIGVVMMTGMLLITGCSKGNQTTPSTQQTNSIQPQQSLLQENVMEVSVDSIDALDEVVEKDVSDTITTLTQQYAQLQIETYDQYVDNIEKVEAFYDDIQTIHQSLCIRLMEYSVKYAKLIIDMKTSIDDKYDALDVLYDTVYDDFGDDIYDGVYDSLLDDMYALYDEILADGYDDVAYKEWSKNRSQEYRWWSKTKSEVYEQLSDARSDIYAFTSDIKGEVYSHDIDAAKKVIQDFEEDIIKIKEKTNSK